MMNHAIHKPLFGKQESQESIQESRNQAKNLKIPESRQRKFRVADPLTTPPGHPFPTVQLTVPLSCFRKARKLNCLIIRSAPFLLLVLQIVNKLT